MTTQTIEYTEGDDRFDAFIARPDQPGDRPAILVCHAWGGRSELEERKARALAELGYVGAAIDVYGVGKRGANAGESQALMTPLVENPALLRRRLTAAYQAVRLLDGFDPERMGVIRFCFGGMCSILCARMGLKLRGAVSFHGLLKVGAPFDARVQGRILVLHGQDDPMVPTADLAAFAEEMKRIGAHWQLTAYPGVVHAFTNPKANDPSFGTVYDADADRMSWAEMSRFFAEVMA